MSASINIPGDLEPAQFLQRYWQREPLLVRDALPDYISPLTADELAGLALEPDIESRIVVEKGAAGPWELRHGPFQEHDFRQLPESDWTLLVQGVDLWAPATKLILGHFDFLPPWRLDDIMASYAPTGGSVGPHFDQYDVFLLQIEGQRRWKIGDRCSADTPLIKGTDLRIIDDFQHTQEWVLGPGDMLYLPPRVGHWGIAETECLTFSVGFRSPTLADMVGDLATELASQDSERYYNDPRLTPDMASETIDPAFIAHAKKLLHELLDDDDLIADWFARFMTSPKYPELEELTAEQHNVRVGNRRYRNGELLD